MRFQLITGLSGEMFWPRHYSRYSLLWCWITHFIIVSWIFDFRWFNFKTKTFHTLISESIYADDIDFLSLAADDMQHIVDLFSVLCTAFGLEINWTKTKVMFTPVTVEPYIKPIITFRGTSLAIVESCINLGGTSNESMDAEIHQWIQKAFVVNRMLEKWVWTNRNISHKTPMNIYRSCVIPEHLTKKSLIWQGVQALSHSS